ncbi:uncharacterized protein BCR38DRAFT_340587 [Pseudomassariella vexata]|uniref:proline--tRNA ligase n=1 Tax=Pseudomassariella vexata TaxID=1141098 RepID=A0A1Y2E4L5_9PEZI|nr:uncharacterized protein BCR38DRAFT_340587 [Pseudomassariella vexata]ORY66500.1 hypothetical protein BCR38DRAFT_340587 [Pseudomassariella vexata]
MLSIRISGAKVLTKTNKTRSVTLVTTRFHSTQPSHGGSSPHRTCLSETFIPQESNPPKRSDGQSWLSNAGYLRQAHSGIFHMLPLGQRVQEKLERLIDKYMQQVGASKVSLSSLSSQELWKQTNRLEGYGPELFRLSDRKKAHFLLAPTHEEEITTLVKSTVKSYKQLPLRLYQIGRKYRDELRPRQGLLRSREFIMKDLYTFDETVESAMQTYSEVRAAYSRLFDELKLPYVVAEATSGDIGGDLSHEYHLPISVGEDNVISCDSCSYAANEELAVAKVDMPAEDAKPQAQVWRGISKDRTVLVNVWYPAAVGISGYTINTHVINSIVDPSIENAGSLWSTTTNDKLSPTNQKVLNIFDQRLGPKFEEELDTLAAMMLPPGSDLELASLDIQVISISDDGQPLNLLRIREGDSCAYCSSGKLKIQKAIELGHTFHLGTRYSEPLQAAVQNREDQLVTMQMGCHGIGVSRIIGAVADLLADSKGLNWPRAIAPFEAIIIPGKDSSQEDAESVYDLLKNHHDPNAQPIDVVLDDTKGIFVARLTEADRVGYPVIVLLGRRWASEKMCEVQCRRLSIKEDIPFKDLPMYINNILSQL